ncbi:hypothetical protein BGX27_004025 [Mortierella sp. AM989]|nr:hypothetical protein BGX27_004025 [Mortierella sp. AM989]
MKNVTALLAIVAATSMFVVEAGSHLGFDYRCYRDKMYIESKDQIKCGDYRIWNNCNLAAHLDQPYGGQFVDKVYNTKGQSTYGCFSATEVEDNASGCDRACSKRGGCYCRNL